MAQKLRVCGVELLFKVVVSRFGPVQRREPLRDAIVVVDWGMECKLVWLQFGGVNAFNKMHSLNWCLVGRWGDFTDDAPLLLPLKE